MLTVCAGARLTLQNELTDRYGIAVETEIVPY